MTPNRIEGLVLKNYNSFYYVQDHLNNLYECRVRGKVKTRIVTGDRVVICPLGEGKGILEGVLPRQNELTRPKIANASMVLIVFATEQPSPSMMLLDRLLFLVIYNKLQPLIVLNKSDLPGDSKAQDIISYYPRNGFNLIMTSAQKGIGIDELKAAIHNHIAVMAGPSGVGKSSLLNALYKEATAKTQEISAKLGRGKHTTRHVELYPLDTGGWIADTPGFSVLELPNIRREELAGYFIDFDTFSQECRFANCLHYKEKECGVKQAVKENKILPERYSNYITMLEEVIENERCYK
ncbi:MAG: ribosome small subunit-dependent GTPase A [Syntrophomonadaceae bacterium]|jgi:ribosome biogenesis GTPase